MKNGTASFGKAEHLCGVKTIDALFDKGRSFNLSLFRVIYLISEPEPSVPAARIMISIPKRIFKKAVVRNLLKRRIREAYRKNKTELLTVMEQNGKMIVIAIVWTGSQAASFSEIEPGIKEMIKRLSSQNLVNRS